jgi:hypothetical protein
MKIKRQTPRRLRQKCLRGNPDGTHGRHYGDCGRAPGTHLDVSILTPSLVLGPPWLAGTRFLQGVERRFSVGDDLIGLGQLVLGRELLPEKLGDAGAFDLRRLQRRNAAASHWASHHVRVCRERTFGGAHLPSALLTKPRFFNA